MARDKTTTLRNAEKLIQHGKIAHAIREYIDLVEREPDDLLILNTIGDLYLTQGAPEEACRYFGRAAEQSIKEKAVPKAITIYKKIVNAQPENLDAHARLADLLGKQGLANDASRQWLRISELYGASGKSAESRAAFERAVTADPTNASTRMKLAEMCLAEGGIEKAQAHFMEAGRLQVKAGDLQSAANTYYLAVQLTPASLEPLEALLDVSLRLGDLTVVMEQIRKALETTPGNPSLRAMLGRSCLGTGDVKSAADIFQSLVSQDEAFHADMLRVSKACTKAGELDLASDCVDRVMSILINLRQVEQGLEAYKLVLEANPQHIPTLTRLAAAYSNVFNQPRQVEMLERLAECHLKHNPKEALKCIEEILQYLPDSETHLAKHRQAFAAAYPGIRYTAPASTTASADAEPAAGVEVTEGAETGEGGLVEIELLVNYGMTDKAIEKLVALAAADPANKELRRKLASLYQETGKNDKAAEQCLMLASLHEKEGDEQSARTFLAESKKLDPRGAGAGLDPEDLAGRTRATRPVSKKEPVFKQVFPEIESPEDDSPKSQGSQPGSFDEQLQQLDFFVRLGFYQEAQYRLDELARQYPDNPVLGLRREMLRSTSH